MHRYKRQKQPAKLFGVSIKLISIFAFLACLILVVFLSTHSVISSQASGGGTDVFRDRHRLMTDLDNSEVGEHDQHHLDCIGSGCPVPTAAQASITLLIGVVSKPEDLEFRNAARATWMSAASSSKSAVKVVFFFPESSSDLEHEAVTYKDIEFGDSRSRQPLPLGYKLMEHLNEKYRPQLVMRIDVRSYVVIERLFERLTRVCGHTACQGDDIWAGKLVTNQLIDESGREYQSDTGLSMYLPYMNEGAYIMSGSLVSAMSLMESRVGLKMVGPEGISLGLWLIPTAYRRIDLSAVLYSGTVCCIKNGLVTPAAVSICDGQPGGEPPAVLSILERPTYLYHYHTALAACGSK